jgi:hypothetical protein
MAKIKDIVSTIRQNMDGTRDQLYLECVSGGSCKSCYVYGRLPFNQRREFCRRNCELADCHFDLWVIKNM